MTEELGRYKSPPFFEGRSEEVRARIRSLLLRRFDLAEEAPSRREAPAEGVGAPRGREVSEGRRPELQDREAVPGAEQVHEMPKAVMEQSALKPCARTTPEEDFDVPPRRPSLRTRVSKAMDLFWAALEEEVFTGLRAFFRVMDAVKKRYRAERTPDERATITLGGIGVAFLVLLLIVASLMNTGRFCFQEVQGRLALMRGKRAPAGWYVVEHLDGARLPDPPGTVYSIRKAYPIALDYYRKKSEEVLKTGEGTDYAGARRYLEKALPYALSAPTKREVWEGIYRLDFLELTGRAEKALTAGVLKEAEGARELLRQAAGLARTDEEKTALNRLQSRADQILSSTQSK
ncbi:hypothetical protein ACFL0Q_08650 [Thermodesulfobacteriota bacterium]